MGEGEQRSPDDYEPVAGRVGRRLVDLDLATPARVFAAYEEISEGARRPSTWKRCCSVRRSCWMRTCVPRPDSAGRYRWMVVDEFQDVSALQRRLLDLWLGGREDVCVVGDPAQAIYSFAGADAQHLLGFARRYPDAPVITLNRNYRSTPEVVAAANALLTPTRSSNQTVLLRSQRGSGPVVRYPGHAMRWPSLLPRRRIKPSASRGSRGEIAVLFRVNAQSEAFEAARPMQFPYLGLGGQRFSMSEWTGADAGVVLCGPSNCRCMPWSPRLDAVLTSMG